MPRVTVEVFPPLSGRLAPGQVGPLVWDEAIGERETLRQLFQRLAQGERRALTEAAYDQEKGTLTHHVLVIINGQSLSLRQGLETVLVEGDRIGFLPAYGGGAWLPA